MVQSISRSIRRKLVLVALAASFTALLVAGAAAIFVDLRNFRASSIQALTTEADILARASARALRANDYNTASEYLALLEARSEVDIAAIYNDRGKIFAAYSRTPNGTSEIPVLPGAQGGRVEAGRLVVFKRIVHDNEILGTVFLRADYPLLSRVVSYLGVLGAIFALSLVVAFFMSAWLQAAVTNPVLAIRDVARRVMETRDFSLRVKKTTRDEIGYLVDAFNDMLTEIGRGADALKASNRTLEREMSERARAERELRELNVELEHRVAARTAELEAANKELESFSYSISHDLRAPVRAIIGFSRMLSEDHLQALDKEARRLLDVVQSEAQRIGALIDDLLAFSRLGRQAMQFTDLDMTQLAHSTYHALSAGSANGSRIEFHLGSLPRGRGDRTLMGQVWANLLANALKFSSKLEKPRIEVSAISDEKEHVYFVRDNGVGFDPRYQAKLYGVFQRLHDAAEFPGTGVGLALVQRIVVRHGGRVWAEGRPNEGATFYFTLPKEQVDGTV